uniref:Histone H4 n=1 Tax=Crocodylus porosus TaxID=8502 RepID=A0A7M4ELD6_CROPO
MGDKGSKSLGKWWHQEPQGITKPGICLLAQCGSMKRISSLIYKQTHGVLKVFLELENVICDAITYIEHAKRKTVAAMDVVYARKCQGHTLYSFRS